MQPCLVCWTPTTGTRCPTHERQHQAHRTATTPTRAHRNTYAWEKLARDTITEWREHHGNHCPGWRRPPHPATDLTADHWNPGDPTLLIVLCRSCNSSKGDTTPTPDDVQSLQAQGIAP